MAQVKNIIFDFDGTLVDTAPLIIKTMQAAMRVIIPCDQIIICI